MGSALVGFLAIHPLVSTSHIHPVLTEESFAASVIKDVPGLGATVNTGAVACSLHLIVAIHPHSQFHVLKPYSQINARHQIRVEIELPAVCTNRFAERGNIHNQIGGHSHARRHGVVQTYPDGNIE